MTIRELDTEIKELVNNYSVYGVESLINALVRACKNEKHLGSEALHCMIEQAIQREINRED